MYSHVTCALIILSLSGRHAMDGLVGYDCAHQNVNITAVSLSGVDPCVKAKPDTTQEIIDVTLLQHVAYRSVPVSTCHVIRHRRVSRCGILDTADLLHLMDYGSVIRLTKDQCSDLIRTNTLVYDSIKYDNLLPGIANIRQGFVIGRQDADGSCEGQDYTTDGVHVTKAMVHVKLQIQYQVSNAIRTEDNSLKFKTLEITNYDLGSYYSPAFGSMFWDTEVTRPFCDPGKYSVIYRGPAYIYSSGTIRTLVVNESQQAMAVVLGPQGLLCGYHAISTEHPTLTAIRSMPGMQLPFPTTLLEENIDMALYMNSKFVYVERHTAGQLSALHDKLAYDICMSRYQQFSQLISLAYIDPEEFAWAYTHEPGVTALLRGEAVYLLRCIPTVVEFATLSRCYQEIPVTLNGTLKFLKPRTRIIVEIGTELACSPFAPPLYNLGGVWVQLHPSPHVVHGPVALVPESSPQWTYTPLQHLMSAGLYNRETIQKYQKRVLFPIEKKAIEQVIASRAGGWETDMQGVSMTPLFDQKSLSLMHEDYMDKLYGYYWKFSIGVSGLIGFVMIFGVLKYILRVLVDGAFLYRAFGFSKEMTASLWSTAAKHVLYRRAGQEDCPVASTPLPKTPESRMYPML